MVITMSIILQQNGLYALSFFILVLIDSSFGIRILAKSYKSIKHDVNISGSKIYIWSYIQCNAIRLYRYIRNRANNIGMACIINTYFT